MIGIESSTDIASVAIGCDIHTLEQITIEGHAQHAQQLLPTLGAIMAAQGVEGSNCLGIAVDIGPGGFTGLRTACGIAQGLATGWSVPCACYTSLELIGLQGRQSSAQPLQTQRWLCCSDARLNECYWAVYDIDLVQTPQGPIAKTMATMIEPSLSKPAHILANNAELQGSIHGIAASGFSMEQLKTLEGFVGSAANTSIEITISPPLAATLVQQTLLRLNIELDQTSLADAVHCQPLYIRDRVAQTTAERLAEKHGQPCR